MIIEMAQEQKKPILGPIVHNPLVVNSLAEQGIPVLQPLKMKDAAFHDALVDLRPELLVVVAYGRILRRRLLELAPYGPINVHFSLLPKYRGAAPVNWALYHGDTRTGVTVIAMTPATPPSEAPDSAMSRSTSGIVADHGGQVFGEASILVECLPFELAICLPDQNPGWHGQRQEKHGQQALEATFVEAFHQCLWQHHQLVGHEAVACAADCNQVFGGFGISLDLASQFGDMNIDGSCLNIEVPRVSPYLRQ